MLAFTNATGRPKSRSHKALKTFDADKGFPQAEHQRWWISANCARETRLKQICRMLVYAQRIHWR